MSNVQFQEILGAIQRMSDNLGSRISWLERIMFGAIGAVTVIVTLHGMGLVQVGG